jgi:hypothetical protein
MIPSPHIVERSSERLTFRVGAHQKFDTLAPLRFGTEIALKRVGLAFFDRSAGEELSAYFLCLFCGVPIY